MKSASYLAIIRCSIPLFLLTSLSSVPIESEAQGVKRKGGFGSLFKKRTEPAVAPANQSDDEIAFRHPKAIALKAVLMGAIPPNRHYRETMANGIVLAYQQRGFKNLWNSRQMPERLFRSLSFHLSRHGLSGMMALDPNAFTIAVRNAPVNNRDLGYTIAIADAGTMVRTGAVDPALIWPDWDTDDTPGINRKDAASIAQDLLRISMLKTFDAGIAVDMMAPRNWIYRELQRGYISSKRALTESIDPGPQLPNPATTGMARPGFPYPYAPILAEALAVRGFLKMPAATRKSLRSVTPELAEGIKEFQRALGLTADGIVGSGTWKYLHFNPAEDYRSRLINLHRARLLPDGFGEKYLIVNIPSAEVFGFENSSYSMSMRMVHGKNSNEEFHTPIFRDVMQEVVFAPYWNVPESISVKEIFPKLGEDPTYLERNHYEIVNNFRPDTPVHELNEETLAQIGTGELFLRQKPTGANALGRVKFLFPNRFNIYLHDTPSKQDFSLSDRAQSHGCIRIANPALMAEWALEGQGWDRERIEQSLQSEEMLSQGIAQPVNVYITYLTSFPRPTGAPMGKFVLARMRDVYNLDAKDTETLAPVMP